MKLDKAKQNWIAYWIFDNWEAMLGSTLKLTVGKIDILQDMVSVWSGERE